MTLMIAPNKKVNAKSQSFKYLIFNNKRKNAKTKTFSFSLRLCNLEVLRLPAAGRFKNSFFITNYCDFNTALYTDSYRECSHPCCRQVLLIDTICLKQLHYQLSTKNV